MSYDECRSRVGWGLRRLVERSVPDGTSEEVIDRAYHDLVERYFADPTAHSRVYDGVPELLDQLAERRIPMAVLSNKTHHITEVVVKELFGRWTFGHVQGAMDGVPRKPDPESALSIAKKLGVEAKSMLFVGDTSVDMETSRGAGMFPVGVAWGFRSPQELSEAGAKLIVDYPLELLTLLDAEEQG